MKQSVESVKGLFLSNVIVHFTVQVAKYQANVYGHYVFCISLHFIVNQNLRTDLFH
jgi:hypothetical protein